MPTPWPPSFSTSSATPRRIAVVEADITTLRVDAIVNAANEAMLGGGGVDGAIHRAAGPELLEACRLIGPCPTGDARVSPAFQLPSRWIIHAVGPVWMGGQLDEDRLLASCYRASLKLAAEKRARTLAFPAISCGIFGYPLARACDIAVRTLLDGLQRHPTLEQVQLAVIDAPIEAALRDSLRRLET